MMSRHALMFQSMMISRAKAATTKRAAWMDPLSCWIGSDRQTSAATAAEATPRRCFHTSPMALAESAPRHGTTIVCVRKNGQVCMMGDGMVSQGSMIVKPNAVKLRRISPKRNGASSSSNSSSSGFSSTNSDGSSKTDDDNNNNNTNNDNVTIVGFAGSTADAFTLLERLEGKLDEYPGQLARSCVELAKGWRTDKYLRRLEASLIVADASCSLELTGNGDVLESHDGVLGVGSGSPYAIAAARALIDIPDLTAEQVAKKAMLIASEMCVYTNQNFVTETLVATTSIVSTDDAAAAATDATDNEKDGATPPQP